MCSIGATFLLSLAQLVHDAELESLGTVEPPVPALPVGAELSLGDGLGSRAIGRRNGCAVSEDIHDALRHPLQELDLVLQVPDLAAGPGADLVNQDVRLPAHDPHVASLQQ